MSGKSFNFNSTDDIVRLLENHSVKATSIRILIMREISRQCDTFTLTDLEEALDTVDKSTLFRTLTLFASHHLLHETDDGSGAKKYCLCHNPGVCRPREMHCHFYCESCKKTFCLDTVIPPVSIPEGYEATEAEYVIKGKCPACSGIRM